MDLILFSVNCLMPCIICVEKKRKTQYVQGNLNVKKVVKIVLVEYF